MCPKDPGRTEILGSESRTVAETGFRLVVGAGDRGPGIETIASTGAGCPSPTSAPKTHSLPAREVERLFYGFSVHCLPVGMVGEGTAGKGTVIGAQTVRRYAEQAGFSSCQVLRIENDFWRFYLLRP